MAENTHGGYRRPSQPAAASGPGALSQRTDGGATQAPMLASGGPYGSRKDMAEIQGSAPLAGPGGPAAQGGPQVAPRDMLTPLDAPSTRPNEDVRAGIDSVPQPNPSSIDDETRQRLLGALPVLAWLASQPKASEQTRQFYRSVRADL